MDGPPNLEQVGGGYTLRASIKSTPKSKNSEDDEMIKIKSNGRPEYVPPPPKILFVEGTTLINGLKGTNLAHVEKIELPTSNTNSIDTSSGPSATLHGWEDYTSQVTPDELLKLSSNAHSPFDSEQSQTPTPSGSPTPQPLSSLRPATFPTGNAASTIGATTSGPAGPASPATEPQGSCDRREDDDKPKPEGGSAHNGTDAEDGDEETGYPIATLHSEFNDLHAANTTPAAWRTYEGYFSDNKAKEQARHRDAQGNPVPNAKAQECWRSFKQLHNYRKILAVHRELKLASTEQTLRERRKLFQAEFSKFSKLADNAYDHSFDVFMLMVGNSVNEDNSLAVSYSTPGLIQFPARLGATTDEFLGFARTEAYHVLAHCATDELVKGRDTETQTKGSEASSSSSDVIILDHKKPSNSKPATVEQERNLCKVALFELFAKAGHPLTGTSKGKGKFKGEQLPWSTMPAFLMDEGIQLVDYPWGVLMPSNATKASKNGIKCLPTAPTHTLLEALRGEGDVTPSLKQAQTQDLRSYKLPVILSSAPPPDAVETHGDVVFADGRLEKNSRKYGVPRRPSAATSIKGKPRAGQSSNPINVASSVSPSTTRTSVSPSPRPQPRPRKRIQSRKMVVTDSEEEYQKEQSDEETVLPTTPSKPRMTRSKGPPKLTTPATLFPKPKISATHGKTVAEVMADQRELAVRTIRKAAKVPSTPSITDKTLNVNTAASASTASAATIGAASTPHATSVPSNPNMTSNPNTAAASTDKTSSVIGATTNAIVDAAVETTLPTPPSGLQPLPTKRPSVPIVPITTTPRGTTTPVQTMPTPAAAGINSAGLTPPATGISPAQPSPPPADTSLLEQALPKRSTSSRQGSEPPWKRVRFEELHTGVEGESTAIGGQSGTSPPIPPSAGLGTGEVGAYPSVPMDMDPSPPQQSADAPQPPLFQPPPATGGSHVKIEADNVGGPPHHAWSNAAPSLYPPAQVSQSSPTSDLNSNAASLAPLFNGPPAIRYASRPSPTPEALLTEVDPHAASYQHPSYAQQPWNGYYPPPGPPPNNYYSPGPWTGYNGLFTGPAHQYQPYNNAPPTANYGTPPPWLSPHPNHPGAPSAPPIHGASATHAVPPTHGTPPTYGVPPLPSAPPTYGVSPLLGTPPTHSVPSAHGAPPAHAVQAIDAPPGQWQTATSKSGARVWNQGPQC
ncbi:hypothetical protein C0991_010227 [Blastosporella zonata]|nr:hypothetical protein C0991_010227 [Blastosporella zonata]